MYATSPFIEETRFGNWFLRTDTWRLRVLCRALDDLQRLMPAGVQRYARVLDVGCGYIHSLPIRLLFRHPMEVQKSAEEYIAIVRAAGFALPDENISLPYLWWSRPDLGLFERIAVPVPQQREETLVNAVAVKT